MIRDEAFNYFMYVLLPHLMAIDASNLPKCHGYPDIVGYVPLYHHKFPSGTMKST